MVLHVLFSLTAVSCSPLPTIHKEITGREDGDPQDVDPEDVVAQRVSPSDPLKLPSKFLNEGASDGFAKPDLPDAAQQNTTESRDFRRKYRRIKSPVRRRNRVLLLLKSEMGKVQIAIEDVKDECLRKKMTENDCQNQKISLQLQGKLRRIQSAWMSVKQLGHEAEQIQDMEVQAQKDLQNATKYQSKAKTMLSGRMIALKDVEKRVDELTKEDNKNAKMQTRFEAELNNGWARMKNANAAQRTVESYNIKFRSKLRGILQGMQISDASASEDFDTAAAISKKAELVDARATILEDKAKRILEEKGKNQGQEGSSGQSMQSVEYQENEDGILASDSATPLDGFGVARAHPTFGKRQFMAQNQPLLVGKEEKLNNLGEKSEVESDADTFDDADALDVVD